MNHCIFHIDVNSAYLSWEAVDRLSKGESLDIRNIASAVGGDEKKRHGIILAKSIAAKKYGIQTGESLYSARQKCPHLMIIPPNYDLYMRASHSLYELLLEYTDEIQRYSIDEVFLNIRKHTYMPYKNPYALAQTMRTRIKNELGFTVSIGISTNKLLAKMAGELKKPDACSTLYPQELHKMWSLPVQELFMVGSRTKKKLNHLGIYTIGELAQYDPHILYQHMKSHGILVWNYANGRENSIIKIHQAREKSVSNSTTISFDTDDLHEIHLVILALCETLAYRLREKQLLASCICLSLKDTEFYSYRHQKKIEMPCNNTNFLFEEAKILMKEMWKGQALRHISIHLSKLSEAKHRQIHLLYDQQQDRRHQEECVEQMVDTIRKRFGTAKLYRAAFIDSGIDPTLGGVGSEEDYIMMNSQL